MLFLLGFLDPSLIYCKEEADVKYETPIKFRVDEDEKLKLMALPFGYKSGLPMSDSGVRSGRRAEIGLREFAMADKESTSNSDRHIMNEKNKQVSEAVANIYETMSEEDDNYRFDLIFDAEELPDPSFLDQICPGDCRACNETNAEVLCRLCCPELFTKPFSFVDMYTQSGHSEILYNHLVDQVLRTGYAPVFSSLVLNDARVGHDMARAEVKAMIQRFQWLKNLRASARKTPVMNQAFVRKWDRDYLVRPTQVCGYYEDGKMLIPRPRGGRIMGGSEVLGTRQFPWQMSLAVGHSTMFYHHHCGAALISDRWVLTAAHCLYNIRNKIDESKQSLYVMGGFIEISERETAQIFEVEEFIIHERFVPRLYEQDIALIRLKTAVVYTPSLLPVCLPRPSYGRRSSYSRNLGRKATLTGWGRKWNNGPLSQQLEMVELPIISNTMCMEWYNRSGSRQFIPEETFLCAGWEQGKMDACSGDSGGPLVIFRKDGRAEVMGVVSWGVGCGVKGRPGVYTRLSEYVHWIRNTMRKYDQKSLYNS